jgi:hypothetical protein
MEYQVDLTKLKTLKEKVLLEEEFSGVWGYFFDNFGDVPKFMDLGKKVKNIKIKTIVEKVSQEILAQADARVTNFMIIELAKYGFIHGAFTIGNRLGNLIYYKEIDTGMVVIAPRQGSDVTLFGRFSITDVKKGMPIRIDAPTEQIH